MPDRIDRAVDRIDRASAHQRRIEAVAVAIAIAVVLAFQVGNRVSFLGAQSKANRDAAKQRAAFNVKLDEQGAKLDDANRRVGQLEEALKAAGLPVPEETPSVPSSSTTTTVPRTTTTFFGRPFTTTTTTTTRPQPGPTTTSTTRPPSTTTTACPIPVTIRPGGCP